MEQLILNRRGLGVSYSSIERVRRRSSILCGFMFGTAPIGAVSSLFEPVLEPLSVLCLSIPGNVNDVKKPSPCFGKIEIIIKN